MLKGLRKGEVALLFNRILSASPEELNDFGSTVIERWLAHTVRSGLRSGNVGLLFNFLDRLYGKDTPYYNEEAETQALEMTLEEKKELLRTARVRLERLEAEVKSEEGAIEL